MRRLFITFLIVAAVVVGGGIVASLAYQVGLNTAISTAVTDDGATVVTPVGPGAGYPGPGYGYGYGWHPFGFGGGFGIFGLLVGLFFLFLLFALIRAAFFGGWNGQRRDWGGPGAPGGRRWGPWEDHAHDTFDDWHRRAHEADRGTGTTGSTAPPSTAG